MKHIKGMLVFIGLFILVGCAPDQEPTKQTTSGPQETKQVKQVTVTNQTTSAAEKQAPTKNEELIANQLTFDSHEYTYQQNIHQKKKRKKCFGPINRLWD